MRKHSFVLVILAIVLVFGWAFVSCDGGVTNSGSGTGPRIVEFITTDHPGNPISNFGRGQALRFRVSYYSIYQDVDFIQLYVKQGNTVLLSFNWSRLTGLNEPKSDELHYHVLGGDYAGAQWRNFSDGRYTAEVYVQDIDGNKSNTMRVSFRVGI